jgi:transposase, IS30 family
VKYQQLTRDERYQIAALHKQKMSMVDIARTIGRHASTVGRELARNKNEWGEYTGGRAHERAEARRDAKAAKRRKIHGELQALIEQKLKLSWSPEQIAGRLRLELSIAISHETIYQHVLRDTHEKSGILRYCLRFGGYRQGHSRFKKSHCAERTRNRKNRIDSRPAAANERTELGHWERDCLLGTRGGPALVTFIDRRSRFVKLRYVTRVDTKMVADATIAALKSEPTKSVTNDNGAEFRGDEKLQRALRTKIYFCDPSSPWQRGSVENANGLIRQYAAKGKSFDDMNSDYPSMIAETLNHRPRKVLGYRTPQEVFLDEKLWLLTDPKLLRFGLEYSAHV